MVAHVRQPLVDGIRRSRWGSPPARSRSSRMRARIGWRQRLCDPRIHQVERGASHSATLVERRPSGKRYIRGLRRVRALLRRVHRRIRLRGVGPRDPGACPAQRPPRRPAARPRLRHRNELHALPRARVQRHGLRLLDGDARRGGPPRSRRAAGARRHPRAARSGPVRPRHLLRRRAQLPAPRRRARGGVRGDGAQPRARRAGDFRPELAVRVPDHVRRGQRDEAETSCSPGADAARPTRRRAATP